MLLEVVLPFEALAADLAAEGELGALVGPLVDHQIVGFGEAALAVLADEFTFSAHFPAKLAATNVVVDLHNRKHVCRILISAACSLLSRVDDE